MGRPRKPTSIHLVKGTYRPDRHGPRPAARPVPEGQLGTRPRYLKGRAAKLWDQVAAFAWWLSEVDSYKLGMWCTLQAEFEYAPEKMIASRITQLRAVGGDLGIDPAARARLGIIGRKTPEKPIGKDPYFED